jgi:hypothetical protein
MLAMLRMDGNRRGRRRRRRLVVRVVDALDTVLMW